MQLLIILGVFLLPTAQAFIAPNESLYRKQTQIYLGDFFKFFNEKNDNDIPPTPVSDNDITTKKDLNSSLSDDDPVEKLFNLFFGLKEEKVRSS